MNTIRFAISLLLEAAVIAGCNDRSTPTAIREQPVMAVDPEGNLTSVVADPVGDVKNKTPAWLDLTSTSITRSGGRFAFDWNVVAPIPTDPALDPDVSAHSDHICLGTGLDIDPLTAPVGYPFGKNEANFAEFYVAICWTPTGSFGMGTGFNGLLIDRRQLLIGGQAAVTPLDFSLDGTHVSVVASAAALGDPTTFSWVAFSEIAQQADPNDAAWFPDVAPEVFNGAPVAIWPQ